MAFAGLAEVRPGAFMVAVAPVVDTEMNSRFISSVSRVMRRVLSVPDRRRKMMPTTGE